MPIAQKTYKLDVSELNSEERDLPFYFELESFMDRVSVANPLFDFKISKQGITNYWKNGETYRAIGRIGVYQDGEHLGCISTNYRGYGSSREDVFGVESFRVSKERGDRNTTYSKDIKVALRNVRKSLVARDNSELAALIRRTVSGEIDNMTNARFNALRWGMDAGSLSYEFMTMAWEAHKQGKTEVTLPVAHSCFRNYQEHLANYAQAELYATMNQRIKDGTGYGIRIEDGLFSVYDFKTQRVTRCKDIDELPKVVAERIAVFKILREDELVPHLGVKFRDGYLYVVDDALPSA